MLIKEMESVFIHLGLILLTTFIISYIAKIFKQPLIIGYILSGIVISPFIIIFGASREIIDIFSQFGITLLLFIVGLHLNPKVVREMGLYSVLIGLGQMILTFCITFIVSVYFLKIPPIPSIYLGIALMLSSTILIMKLLSDEKNLESLNGKISIGILIIQDLVAILILIIISSFGSEGTFISTSLKSLLFGVVTIIVLFFCGFFIIPKILNSISKSQELLFLFSICFCFVIAALFSYLGLSIEIGALIAGIILSVSPYSIEISSKIKPLRDFFIIIFFIILGLNIDILEIKSIFINSIIFALIALLIKPLIIMLLMSVSGFTKRNNFLVGTTLGQISEFSFIIFTLGVSLGHINSQLLSTITLTGIITITLSAYMIIYSNKIYSKVSFLFWWLEKKENHKRKENLNPYNVILFGYNRIGFEILLSLKKIKKKYLVIDFNPDIIKNLEKMGISSLYGDADDVDFLEELPLEKAELVISTIPDIETNLLLVESIRRENKKAIIIGRAHNIEDALKLYKRGASYVLTPHFLGGEYISKMIENSSMDKIKYEKEKEKHIRKLNEIKKKGMNHHIEKN